MARVVSVETMRQSDAYTIANMVPSKELMYRAGRGIFETVDKYGSTKNAEKASSEVDNSVSKRIDDEVIEGAYDKVSNGVDDRAGNEADNSGSYGVGESESAGVLYTCDGCSGLPGEKILSGDMHNSEGMVPCETMIAFSGMGSCRRWYLTCTYGCSQNNTGWREPVAIAAGKGNNAGDGYVVAEMLHDRGIAVEIVLLEEKFSEDGKYYFDECVESGIPVKMFRQIHLSSEPGSEKQEIGQEQNIDKGPLNTAGEEASWKSHENPEISGNYEACTDLSSYGTIVDCLLGTGFSGDVREPMASFIRAINTAGEAGAFVVSADLNSGLNGDTGEGSLFVRSDLTVSIGEFKYGHFIGRADDAMKDKVNVDIGIEIVGEVAEI